jgi:hypothetical protein
MLSTISHFRLNPVWRKNITTTLRIEGKILIVSDPENVPVIYKTLSFVHCIDITEVPEDPGVQPPLYW